MIQKSLGCDLLLKIKNKSPNNQGVEKIFIYNIQGVPEKNGQRLTVDSGDNFKSIVPN